MSQITLRILKGTALTQSEMDDNLKNLVNSSSIDQTTGALSLFTSESSGATKTMNVLPAWVDYSGSTALGVASVTGSLVVSGNITAQQFNTEIISSSTIFESGSTIFGDDSNDLHQITGSLLITGSQILSGSQTVSGSSTITGVIDSTGMSSKIRFHYNEYGDLPSATTYHGMFAHVHATGSAYFAHGGNWVQLANSSSFATDITTLNAASASHETSINTLVSKTLVSSSIQIQGYDTFLEKEGDSVISGSAQIALLGVGILSSSAGIAALNSSIVSSSAQTIANLPTGTVSGSLQIDALGFLKNEGDLVVSGAAQITALGFSSALGGGLVSSSAQINHDTTENFVAGEHFLQSAITAVGTVAAGNVTAILPTGTVSGSAQVISSLPTGTISGSAQLPGGIISGSSQIAASLPAALVSGSAQVVSHLPTGTMSGSVQTVANLSNQDVDLGSGDITATTAVINGTITATGDITAFFSSDERLKYNITPIKGALGKINQIGGYEFDWNDKSEHTGHDVGVIAQEIEKVLPELVVDRDTGYKAVRYDKIVALLINAIKEQQLQIQELKKRL
jgi:hypothetical protein|tara:strand:+ start:733 stop:2436 length:1704 start_codon:yes stop_codon:yes gene_type:complete